MWTLDSSSNAIMGVMDMYDLDLLKDNFLAHYNGNRAPFGVFLHPRYETATRCNSFWWSTLHPSHWLRGSHTCSTEAGLATVAKFMRWAAKYDDVYFVSNNQLVSKASRAAIHSARPRPFAPVLTTNQPARYCSLTGCRTLWASTKPARRSLATCRHPTQPAPLATLSPCASTTTSTCKSAAPTALSSPSMWRLHAGKNCCVTWAQTRASSVRRQVLAALLLVMVKRLSPHPLLAM